MNPSDKDRTPQLNGAICGRRSGVCSCPCSKGDGNDSDQGEVMSETPLEADEGVSCPQAMVEEQEYLDNKIVLVNTRWIDFVYNDDGFHIYHGNATDEEKLLSRTFEALQLEAGEGDKTPMYMDHQCEMDMSMTLSDACSWRSHSPGVLVEGIGRWVDEVQMPVNARLTLVANHESPYPESIEEEDFVFES